MGRRWEPARTAMTGLKRLAAATDLVRRAERGVVVLAYHRVGMRTRVRVDLPEWLFEEQMARLTSGSGVVSLDTALEILEREPTIGTASPTVVTFDDGTADFVDIAVPILVKHRIPAVLYVATDFIDSGRWFPDEGRPASWAGLSDAVSTGLVAVGSHTHTHVLLDRTPGRQVADELDRSIELIGERLGSPPLHFAYPKALPGSAQAEKEVRIRFRSAALAGTRPNRFGHTDPYRLARSPVQVDDGLRFFERKVHGGMRLEDDVRRLAGRWRFARAAS